MYNDRSANNEFNNWLAYTVGLHRLREQHLKHLEAIAKEPVTVWAPSTSMLITRPYRLDIDYYGKCLSDVILDEPTIDKDN